MKNNILPYVYKIINKTTNEFYYGSRSANVALNIPPEDDIGQKYFTSGSLREDFESNKSNYDIEIIFQSDASFEFKGKIESAIFWYEQCLIRENIKNPLCKNKWFQDPDTNKKCFSNIGERYITINNGVKNTYLPVGTEVPEGWVKGAFRTEEQKMLRSNTFLQKHINRLKLKDEKELLSLIQTTFLKSGSLKAVSKELEFSWLTVKKLCSKLELKEDLTTIRRQKLMRRLKVTTAQELKILVEETLKMNNGNVNATHRKLNIRYNLVSRIAQGF